LCVLRTISSDGDAHAPRPTAAPFDLSPDTFIRYLGPNWMVLAGRCGEAGETIRTILAAEGKTATDEVVASAAVTLASYGAEYAPGFHTEAPLGSVGQEVFGVLMTVKWFARRQAAAAAAPFLMAAE
jgi:hypothetical protein